MRKFIKLLLGAAIVFSAAPHITAQSRNSITGIALSLRKMILLASNSPNSPFANYYLGLSLVRAGKAGDAEGR